MRKSQGPCSRSAGTSQSSQAGRKETCKMLLEWFWK
uniref:Uncharacterized protein n=1 Tax=Anguilla anguilla TaxID=7936 RepID=A0A0E9R381_ANGAN